MVGGEHQEHDGSSPSPFRSDVVVTEASHGHTHSPQRTLKSAPSHQCCLIFPVLCTLSRSILRFPHNKSVAAMTFPMSRCPVTPTQSSRFPQAWPLSLADEQGAQPQRARQHRSLFRRVLPSGLRVAPCFVVRRRGRWPDAPRWRRPAPSPRSRSLAGACARVHGLGRVVHLLCDACTLING